MANERTLPGFVNIIAEQLDDDRLILSLDTLLDGAPCVIVDRSDYDSDQEFMMECIQWARRNGGIEVPS